MNKKIGEFSKPTNKCLRCRYYVENGLGMRYCNAPMIKSCNIHDRESGNDTLDVNDLYSKEEKQQMDNAERMSAIISLNIFR